nr:immunoglobulin light chain junction region [Macaca mulatta]
DYYCSSSAGSRTLIF